MPNRRTLGLIGCGAIARKHVAAILELPDFIEIVSLCDLDVSRMDAISDMVVRSCGSAPKYYTEYRDLLKEQRPDVVAIATASDSHAQMAIDSFDAGCDVVLEKPVALSTVDSHAIVEALNNSGKTGTVGYILRFLPHMRGLKSAVDSGRFGRILHASVSIHWNRNQSYYEQARWRGSWDRDGGALMNQCTHGIDLLQWIVGSKPTIVSGTIRRFQRPIEAEDFGTATVEFESGAVGTLVGTVNVYPSNHDTTLCVFGEKGTVVIGGVALNEIITWDFEGDEPPRTESGSTGHRAIYEDLIASLDGNKQPLVTIADASRSVDIVLAIYKSARDGHKVKLPCEFSTTEMSNFFS